MQKSGSYFSFGDERLGQGRQNATAFLPSTPTWSSRSSPRIQAAGRAGAGRLGEAPAHGAAPDDAAEAEEEAAEPTSGVGARRVAPRTASRAGGRVAVELDARPGGRCRSRRRSRPARGARLHRERARALARERRRPGSRRRRGPPHRDLTERRIAAATRLRPRRALSTLSGGSVDDARFASRAALADRGYGDAAIRSTSSATGSPARRRRALSSLEPEPERAAALVERFGGGLRGARLARRGFGEDALEAPIAGEEAAQ